MANTSRCGLSVVVLSLVAFGMAGVAAHAQGVPTVPIGSPIVPIAYDGRTLHYESFATQATFQAVWGERAEARWVEEHNAELAQGRPLSGPRIVFFSSGSSSAAMQTRDAFVAGLREQGYIPGQTIAIEWRYTEGRNDVIDAVVAEVIGLRPDLIVTVAAPETLAVKKATTTIPIVFTSLSDPVGAGAVPSLERPGGNLTGMSQSPPQLQARRLALLKEAVPGATRVGVLRNASNPASAGLLQEVRDAAGSVGVQIQALDMARVPEDLSAAFDLATQARVDAVTELVDALFTVNRERIVELATQTRLPLMAGGVTVVNGQAGGGSLMAYGPKPEETPRRAAGYVAKILGGAAPVAQCSFARGRTNSIGRGLMPTFVQLLRFTEKGLAAIKEGPSRVEAGKQAVESLGGEVKGWYLLMGQYDAVWIVELPNDEAATKLALRFGALGTVRTETLRAYTLEEARTLIEAVP